jgi:formate C-acetyltransferase
LVKNNPAPSEPYINPEDWLVMEKEIMPYWQKNALDVNFLNLLKTKFPEAFNYAWAKDNLPTGTYFETGTARSCQNWTLDYERVLKKGFLGIKEELLHKQKKLKLNDQRYQEKQTFIEAGLLTCDAAIIWAKRYAEEAEKIAQVEKDPLKKAKFLEIAEICYQVPAHPARTFREALQCQWWVQAWTRIEINIGGNVGNGRMDQYLYPYYQADIAAGRVTNEEVLDLIRMLNLKMYQYIFLPLVTFGSEATSGFAHFECVSLGGQTSEGHDATNELSYLFLESKRGVALTMPDLAVRLHSNTPSRFLNEIAETIKEGQGYPKLLNDEIIIPMLLAKGMPLHMANDWTVNGCMESRQIRCEVYNCGSAYNNEAMSLEMALNDGKIRWLNNLQVGPKTGDARKFKSFDEVWQAWTTQMKYHLKMVFERTILYENFRSKYIASPLSSIVNEPYMHEMKDAMTSGVGFKNKDYLSLVNIDMIGSATLSDSLVAIKKLVFEEKKISMADLIDALGVNWAGKEALRQLCLHAPKWGNNDPEADQMMVKINRFLVDEIGKFKNPNKVVGRNWELRVLPVTFHIVSGKLIGATPNGRKAGEPLSEGCGPQQGNDTHGPTALLNSIAKFAIRDSKHWCSPLLNIKLSPGPLRGVNGTHKLVALILGWLKQKIWHIQMNFISAETLRAAQKDPEKYRNLIVRVAGYSAFFSELDESTQNEIISRTEHEIS